MTHVTCRLTATNRDQLRNPTLGSRIWATFTLLVTVSCGLDAGQSGGGLSTEMTVVIVVAVVLPVIVIASIVLIVIWVKKRRTTASGVNQPV